MSRDDDRPNTWGSPPPQAYNPPPQGFGGAPPPGQDVNRWGQAPTGGWGSKNYAQGASQVPEPTPQQSWAPYDAKPGEQPPYHPPIPRGKQAIMIHPTGKSPLFMALASLVVPGLGQLLLGQEEKGMIMMGVWFFTCFGFLGLMHLIAPVDAFVIASRLQDGRPVREYETAIT